MDKIVKQTKEKKKNAIFNSYNINDQKMLDKIENLFNKINEFGDKFGDVQEFESEFAKSSLNNEYTNIFVEIAKKEIDVASPSVEEMVADRTVSNIKNRIIPSRAVIADKRDSMLRDIPVVGNIMNAGQKIDLFNKFRKNK